METFIFLYGLLLIVVGLIGLINAAVFKKFIDKCAKFTATRPIGIVPFVFGIIFIVGADQTRLPSFVSILGALAILKALCIFFLEEDKLQSFKNYFVGLSDAQYKIYCGLCITIGILLLI